MNPNEQGTGCPIPKQAGDVITLSHGEGGRVMRRLIRDRIVAKLGPKNVQLESDAACLGKLSGDIAMTTDSFVVSPLFFPGGDIGSLAVHGTINDLAMAGAKPLYLTLSLIIEEGFSIETLERVIASVASTAEHCEVKIVAGDTKVVTKGAADGLFINTTGIGRFHSSHRCNSSAVRPGDCLLVSGSIARHGIAVMAARESLGFTPEPETDSAALHHVAMELIDCLGSDLRTMRDATRGGVAAVLHEWAEESGHTMCIEESRVPVRSESQGVCELLGLDPLFIANEGTFVAAVASHRVDDALAVLRSHLRIGSPSQIGEVRIRQLSPVLVSRGVGGDQPLDEPLFAMLPRIC